MALLESWWPLFFFILQSHPFPKLIKTYKHSKFFLHVGITWIFMVNTKILQYELTLKRERDKCHWALLFSQ